LTPLRRNSDHVGGEVAFLAGDQAAYVAGIIEVLTGAALVFFIFPKRDREREMLAEYHVEDMQT
jgi:MFS transporter, DHA2 family, multidrug resistance protein